MTIFLTKYHFSGLTEKGRGRIILALVIGLLVCFVQTATGDDSVPVRQAADSLKNTPENMFQRGKELYEAGRISEAVILWEEVRRINPEYPEVRSQLFEAYKFLGIEKYNQNLQEEAVAVWEKAIRLNPDDKDIKDYIERSKSEIHKLEELSPESRPAAENNPVPEKKPEPEEKPAVKTSKKKDAIEDSLEIYYSRQFEKFYDSLTVLAGNIRKLSDEIAKISPLDTLDKTRLTGFVEAVEYNDHRLRRATFKIDQVELDISGGLSQSSAFRTDIEFTTDSTDEFQADIEQGYIDWRPGSDSRWKITFGKFNAPFGWLPVDAPDRDQYSTALVYAYGRPENVLGLMLTFTCSPVFDWSFYLVNGWDVNVDNNKDKTIGTRLRLQPADEFSCGFSAVTGPERDNNNSSRRSVFDFDLEFKPTPKWLLGGEVSYGLETRTLENNVQADWLALMLLNRFDVSSRAAITGRFDLFNDYDGLCTGFVQDLWSLSLAPSLSLNGNLTARIEGRCDFSDQKVFIGDDEQPSDYRLTTAFELIYRF
ncbi:MAG: outer membrane beta-barrel protein [candidate division Zixibacteria bacterium]|nr:outer membrane beta-barrel protein [candidate division Zixibacteria bacterium]